MNRISHWIDGADRRGTSGRSGTVFNPATGEQAASVDFASVAEVDAAVAAAKAAFPDWRATGLGRRAEVMFHMRELVDANRKEIASLLTAEHGKVLSDALGEVARGLENIEFACGIPHLLKGGYSEQAATGVDVYSIRQPLGVVAGITPFNFPAMVPMWMFANALACGNTFVLKPSEKDPSASLLMAELLAKAGLPGRAASTSCRATRSPSTASSSTPTSPPSASSARRRSPGTSTRPARPTASGCRRSAGPRTTCSCCPTPTSTWPPTPRCRPATGRRASGAWRSASCSPSTRSPTSWSAKIAERIPAMKVGPGNEPDNEMGPLITGEHRDKVRGYVDGGGRRGRDGRRRRPRGRARRGLLPQADAARQRHAGAWRCYDDEIFGPVLSVVRVDSYDEGLELINDNPYGNGMAIFTRDGGAARQFQFDVNVGMVGVNVPIPVPVSYYSFGGWKSSLFGDTHMYGPEGINFYTRGKVVTSPLARPAHLLGRPRLPPEPVVQCQAFSERQRASRRSSR